MLKSEIPNNRNLNGNIRIQADNLKDSKYINKIKFDIQFEEGLTQVTNLVLFKNSVFFEVSDVNLIADNNKLKFAGNVKLDVKDINNFYSHFQIKKDYRKDINQIRFNFDFNLDDGFIEINQLKINGVDNEILEKYTNIFNSEKKNLLNKITFRNTIRDFFKEISLD